MTVTAGRVTDGTVAWRADDLHAWEVLRPLLDLGGYLPWSNGAMRPNGLVEVCNLIVFGAPARVVELGAGASTVLLARLLRERGGRLDAVEHDPAWADWVTADLARESLQETARVTHAPLAPSGHAADALSWYAADALAAAVAGPPIDLLIVDGPPAYAPGSGLARLPAVPALLDRLAPDAVVVLDDIERPGETDVLARWEAATDLRFERREDAGVAVGRRA